MDSEAQLECPFRYHSHHLLLSSFILPTPQGLLTGVQNYRRSEMNPGGHLIHSLSWGLHCSFIVVSLSSSCVPGPGPGTGDAG